MMVSTFILGGIVGLLLGLLICYYKQIKAVYDHRDVISSGSNLISSAQDFYGDLQKL